MKLPLWLLLSIVCAACDGLSFEADTFKTKANPRNCVVTPSLCSADQVCDSLQKICVPKISMCTDSGGCSDDSLAYCVPGTSTCKPCNAPQTSGGSSPTTSEANARCAARAARLGTGTVVCVQGACRECGTNADCTQPAKAFCDQSRNICIGCMEDNQCPGSNVCKKDESLLSTNDTLQNIGECVASGQVAYVNKNAANCASGSGTVVSPFCQIQTAIDSGKSYIRVIAGEEYAPIRVQNSQRVIVYGPGRTQASLLAARVTTGARLTLQDLSLKPAAMTSSTSLIQCDTGSYLTVRRVLVSGINLGASVFGGIIANQCARVLVESTKVDAISGNGMSIIGGRDHQIINSAIIRCGNTSVRDGLFIGAGISNSIFAFNTITNNIRGAQCESNVAITDSIVQGNTMDPMTEIIGSCAVDRVVTSGVTLASTTNGEDPRVNADPMDRVRDKAQVSPLVKADYFGAARGLRPDIGFHEFSP